MPTTPQNTLRLSVHLVGIRPQIWREIEVPAAAHLGSLHNILQTVMGWTDSHLHEFAVDGARYACPDDFDDNPPDDERSVRLRDLFDEPGDVVQYTYDFGDSWEHEIRLEQILGPQDLRSRAVCTAGARSGPPEDVGGIPGYRDFLRALRNPRHERHRELLGWVGGSFDPAAFDRRAVNDVLAQIPLDRAAPLRSTKDSAWPHRPPWPGQPSRTP